MTHRQNGTLTFLFFAFVRVFSLAVRESKSCLICNEFSPSRISGATHLRSGSVDAAKISDVKVRPTS